MKYLPFHLPEAEKGNSVQVIIESTPHLPVPTSQIIRVRKAKTAVCYCQCSSILPEETPFFSAETGDVLLQRRVLSLTNHQRSDPAKIPFDFWGEREGIWVIIPQTGFDGEKNDLQGNTLGKHFLHWKKTLMTYNAWKQSRGLRKKILLALSKPPISPSKANGRPLNIQRKVP